MQKADTKSSNGDGEIFLPFDDSQGRNLWLGVAKLDKGSSPGLS